MGNTEEAVQLLEDILAIPSVNGQDDEGKVAEYLCDYFRKAGISAQVERIDETHANVSAILEGEDNSKRILWNGHLDTVPYGSLEEWSTDPKVPVTKGDSVYARGASDMKSGLCAMAYALCACKKSGKKIPHSIRFAGTCDEEKGGLGAEAVLKKTQEPYDEIIIGEPTGLKMGIAQKGCIWLELKAHGKTSHGAYPEQGCSAVEHILRIVEKIKQFTEKQEHPVLGHATANITKIEGGIAPNMIPDLCTVLMDIRVTPGLTKEELLKEVDTYIEEEEQMAAGGLHITYTVKNNRRAIEISQEDPVTLRLKNCLEKEGIPADITGINFFTDASVIARETCDTKILLFGPGEPDVAHKPNERVSLQKYQKAIAVFEDLIFMEGMQ